MRERLKHDVAPNLPAAPEGTVRLTGLAGLAVFVAKAEPELAANAMLCAVNQRVLAQAPDREPGPRFRRARRLHRASLRGTDAGARGRQAGRSRVPVCGKAMRPAHRQAGPALGQVFWGCTGYPECKGILGASDKSDKSDGSDEPRAPQ